MEKVSFILLLNKFDIFRLKVPVVPMKLCFPGYAGGGDVGKAVDYILNAYLEQNTKNLPVFVQ